MANAAEVARSYGVEGKSFRRFLRSQDIRVGKGKTHKFNGLQSPATVSKVREYLREVQGEELTTDQVKERFTSQDQPNPDQLQLEV